MAGEFSWLQQTAADLGAGLGELVIYLLILGAVFGLILFILWISSYKHRVVVRYLTKNRKFVIEDKAKIVTVDGVPTWKLLKMRKSVKPPSPQAIEITRKGRFFAECYWSEDAPEALWLEDRGEASDAFNQYAYTSDERAYAVAQHQKALSRKKIGVWDRIAQLAPLGAMVMIIAIVFIFWGEITAPAAEIQASNADVTNQLAKISEQNARIAAVFAGKIEAGELVIEQTIPPDARVNNEP